jgi:iron-sulfur cluster repair protein YtfE (RIC family)
MDILDRLMREHRKAEKLISKLAGAQQGPRRVELVEELTDALYTHMVVEERFLYPIVADVLGPRVETEAETEHDLAREGLDQLNELVDRPGFGAALDMVKGGVDHHVREEELVVFPKLRVEAAGRLAGLDLEQLEGDVRTRPR